jgi:hypothetical protein
VNSSPLYFLSTTVDKASFIAVKRAQAQKGRSNVMRKPPTPEQYVPAQLHDWIRDEQARRGYRGKRSEVNEANGETNTSRPRAKRPPSKGANVLTLVPPSTQFKLASETLREFLLLASQGKIDTIVVSALLNDTGEMVTKANTRRGISREVSNYNLILLSKSLNKLVDDLLEPLT